MELKRELMQGLGFRKEFDGAQDFDLVLRAAFALQGKEETIAHLKQVLYHWRCHSASTAENPQSKRYAYEAGLRAVQDFADQKGWKLRAEETRHLGFYRYVYSADPFTVREDVGAVGGPVISRGKIAGGRMDEAGKIFYENLPTSYSGYLHRAVLQQDADVLDLRSIRVREELRPLFTEIVGVPYVEDPKTGRFDYTTLLTDADLKLLSITLGKAIRARGYKLLYLPD